MRTLLLLSVLVGTPALAGTSQSGHSDHAQEGGKIKGIVKAIDTNASTLTLSVQKTDRTFSIQGLTLTGIANGSHVLVAFDSSKPTVATAVTIIPDK
jgi:hypothetical protein